MKLAKEDIPAYLRGLAVGALVAIDRRAYDTAMYLLDHGLHYTFPGNLPPSAKPLWEARIALDLSLRHRGFEGHEGYPFEAEKRKAAIKLLRGFLKEGS